MIVVPTLRTTLIAVLCAGVLGARSDARAADRSERRVRPDAESVRRAVALMRDMARESRDDARRIEAAYGSEARRLLLRDRSHLIDAIGRSDVMPLPEQPRAFNLAPRLSGRSPIGEADLPHQPLYVRARPETLGCLLHVAARVGSPLEITSLVRHEEYQRRLTRTNANARTRLPTHAMGLAFDVSILYATMDEAREIRDVLRRMRDDGDLFFIAESRQLVFHVVPAPARSGYYAAVYEAFSAIPRPAVAPSHLRPLEVSAAALLPPPGATDALLAAVDSPVSIGYGALFAWLLASGLGLPPGEDLVLMLGGGLVSRELLAWWPFVLVAILAVVATDVAMFWAGRWASAGSRKMPLAGSRMTRVAEQAVARIGASSIVAARFLPGVRGLIFAAAGARGMAFRRFLIADAAAAVVWVPCIVAAGAWMPDLGGSIAWAWVQRLW